MSRRSSPSRPAPVCADTTNNIALATVGYALTAKAGGSPGTITAWIHPTPGYKTLTVESLTTVGVVKQTVYTVATLPSASTSGNGARSHVSARYRIGWRGHSEPHSSSGVVISTGAGSTGWLSSIFNMAGGILAMTAGATASLPRPSLSWEDPRLMFVVREPFISRHSRAGVVAGIVEPSEELRLESAMPASGVIFSDGVEADYLNFNSGAVAHIRAAPQKAHLVVP